MDWGSLFQSLGSGAKSIGTNLTKSFQNAEGALDWNRIGALLGNVGATVSPEGSWQQGLGRTASNYHQNVLGGKALAKALGLTPEGVPGNDSVTFDSKGNITTKAKAPYDLGEGLKNPSLGSPSTDKIQNNISSGGGGGGGSDTLDDMLKKLGGYSNFQSSPTRLTSADLVGLDQEQQRALATVMMNREGLDLERARTAADIYKLGMPDNEVVQTAEGTFLVDRASGQARMVEGVPGKGLDSGDFKLIDDYTTGKQYLLNLRTMEKIDIGAGVKPVTEHSPGQDRVVIKYYKPDGTPMPPVVTTYDNYNATVQDLNSKGYMIGEGASPSKPGDISQKDSVALSAYSKMRDTELDESKRKQAITVHRGATRDKPFIYIWNEDEGAPQMVVLPKKKDGTQFLSGAVQDAAFKNGRSIEDELRAKGLIK